MSSNQAQGNCRFLGEVDMTALLHPQQRKVELGLVDHSLHSERQACRQLRQARRVWQRVRHQPRLLRMQLVVPAAPQRMAHRNVAACEQCRPGLQANQRPRCQLRGTAGLAR